MTIAKRARAIVAIVVCGLAIAAAGCAQSGGGQSTDTDNQGQADNGVGGFGTAPRSSASPGSTGGGNNPPPSKQPSPVKQNPVSPSPSTPSGPQIVYFRVKQQPVCQGTTNTQQIIIEWRVTGADKVSLSLDKPGAPGLYGVYDELQGSQEMFFACDMQYWVNNKARHVYYLSTVGGGPERSRQLTVEVPTS